MSRKIEYTPIFRMGARLLNWISEAMFQDLDRHSTTDTRLPILVVIDTATVIWFYLMSIADAKHVAMLDRIEGPERNDSNAVTSV